MCSEKKVFDNETVIRFMNDIFSCQRLKTLKNFLGICFFLRAENNYLNGGSELKMTIHVTNRNQQSFAIIIIL